MNMEVSGGLLALAGVVVANILAPILDRAARRRVARKRSSRAIRDDFYAYQTLLALVAERDRWWSDSEADQAFFLATKKDYLAIAPYLTGEAWTDVSAARRRWRRLLAKRESSAAPGELAHELHDLNTVLDAARKGLARNDKKMKFKPYRKLGTTKAYADKQLSKTVSAKP